MQYKKKLDASEQYHIDELGRICPDNSMGWSRLKWKNSITFDAALYEIAHDEVTKEDFFIGITRDEWLDLKSRKYLCIEDGFFLVTGIKSNVFRFEFREEVFFSMRPDFIFSSLATGLDEKPINQVESIVRDWLIDYYREIEAIQRAISVSEISALKLYSIDTWLEFWESRGISIQYKDMPQDMKDNINPNKSDQPATATALSETGHQTMLKLIIGMAIDGYGYSLDKARNSLTGDKNGLSARLERLGISVGDDTIRKYLKEAKELLPAKGQ